MYLVHKSYAKALEENRPKPHSLHILPITYSLCWALVGGAQVRTHTTRRNATQRNATPPHPTPPHPTHPTPPYPIQMIVHSKAIAELVELIASHSSEKLEGQPFPLTHWFFWVEFSLLAT